MSAVEHTLNALIAMTKDLGIGTNLTLVHMQWMLVNDTLLAQRHLSSAEGDWLVVRSKMVRPR